MGSREYCMVIKLLSELIEDIAW